MSTLTLRPRKDRAVSRRAGAPAWAEVCDNHGVVEQASFARMISLERKRTERSGNPFLLMLLEEQSPSAGVGREEVLRKTAEAVLCSTRETDTVGWYESDAVLGVIFTEIGDASEETMAAILAKITMVLDVELGSDEARRIRISLYRYPELHPDSHPSADSALYPDLPGRTKSKRLSWLIKRSLDVAGSALGLLILSPLLLLIGLAIKLTSEGPVLFRQTRVGQQGVPFTFLKFRSMYVNSDARIHREYVAEFIAGAAESKQPCDKGNGVYKITDDPRVTPFGKVLRKWSLDELPQLLNVLKGEMSLVGPRPPLPYEFGAYDIWHRRRVMEAKPGITGLWQVNGRSRTSFDDMVRMDLLYANNWSLWADLRILLQTPRAVFSGNGAY